MIDGSEEIDYEITPRIGSAPDEKPVIGEILGLKRPMHREEVRFDIAVQHGVAPERVFIEYTDGARLEGDHTVHWAGEKLVELSASHFNFPYDSRHPDGQPVMH